MSSTLSLTERYNLPHKKKLKPKNDKHNENIFPYSTIPTIHLFSILKLTLTTKTKHFILPASNSQIIKI